MTPAPDTVGQMRFFLLVVMPVVEVAVAYLVGRWVGFGWMVLALIVLSGIGIWQIKVQGLAAWRNARGDVLDGSSPAPAAVDGALRFLGAVLLALPGFVSALVGLILLIAPIRNRASRRTGAWVVRRMRIPFVVVSSEGTTGWTFRSSRNSGVVDVEGWEEPAGPRDAPELSPPPLDREPRR